MRFLTNQQRLHLVNTEQLFENYREARRQNRSYRYGMRWKSVRGVDYLFRERDRRGNGKLLGRRDPETEALLETFLAAKTTARQRLDAIKDKLDGRISQSKASEILGMSRSDFLNELYRRRVPAVQTDIAALRKELACLKN